MRRGLCIGAAGLSLAMLAVIVPSSWGQYPLGVGFRGPGVPGGFGYGGGRSIAQPAATAMGAAGGAGGFGYGGGYSPFVGVYAPYQNGYSGMSAAAIASVPSAAYFTYGNTSYTTESPSPIPVYGGSRPPYMPLPPATPLTALLKVQVPLDSEVWLEGQKMHSTGAQRHYRSPPLNPAKGYIYEVRARWLFDGKPVEDVRHVAIRAGTTALVDFTHLDPLVPRPSLPVETPKPPAKKSDAPNADKPAN